MSFSLGKYNRLERDESSDFLSEQYPNLKSWKQGMGLVITESDTVPVCYEGSFVAQKKQFLNQPKESWEKMESSLSRANNLVEGHYAERLWASILSDADRESARAVDEVLSPHIAFMETVQQHDCGMKGMTYP